MRTTLNAIRAHRPCVDGWQKLLSHLGKTAADDEPLLIKTIIDSNGISDAIWCLRAVEGHDREVRLYAVWCVRQIQHLMTDPRSVEALDVAERFARRQATAAEVKEARAAAAATAAWAAWAAVWAAEAALAEAGAARAARVARAATAAAAATAATTAAARAEQSAELLRICREIEAGKDPYPEGDRQ